MSKLSGKKVLIFQQRAWGKFIGRFLARKLYAEGCRLAALTSSPSAHQATLLQDKTELKYEMIESHDFVMGQPKEYLRGETYSLEEICRDLAVDSIWPFIWSLRMFVRSYKEKYYYSFKQNLSDEQIIDYVMAAYKCVKLFFEKFKPDVIIAPNFVSFHHIIFNLMAKKRGATMFALTDSKIVDYSIFTYDYDESTGPFYEQVDKLNANEIETENREKARKYIAEFREKFKKPYQWASEDEKKRRGNSLLTRIRGELSPFKQILLWYKDRPKNPWPNVGIWTGWRPPYIILRDYFAHKKYRQFAQDFNYEPLEKIKKFVYFPLQVQPETAIDVAAPYFSNQIEVARQLAMSLPDDWTLAVKDHPAMLGLHPSSYLEKLARTVNVKLIDYRIPTQEILKRADLLVSFGGTTLVEAAFLAVPAIQLGNLGTTLKLPNVFKHTDMTTLAKKIKEVLAVDLNSRDYERRLENYAAAVYDTGFEINYLEVWEKAKTESLEDLWKAYYQELERIL